MVARKVIIDARDLAPARPKRRGKKKRRRGNMVGRKFMTIEGPCPSCGHAHKMRIPHTDVTRFSCRGCKVSLNYRPAGNELTLAPPPMTGEELSAALRRIEKARAG